MPPPIHLDQTRKGGGGPWLGEMKHLDLLVYEWFTVSRLSLLSSLRRWSIKETQEQIVCVFKSVALVFGMETALAG